MFSFCVYMTHLRITGRAQILAAFPWVAFSRYLPSPDLDKTDVTSKMSLMVRLLFFQVVYSIQQQRLDSQLELQAACLALLLSLRLPLVFLAPANLQAEHCLALLSLLLLQVSVQL